MSFVTILKEQSWKLSPSFHHQDDHLEDEVRNFIPCIFSFADFPLYPSTKINLNHEYDYMLYSFESS